MSGRVFGYIFAAEVWSGGRDDQGRKQCVRDLFSRSVDVATEYEAMRSNKIAMRDVSRGAKQEKWGRLLDPVKSRGMSFMSLWELRGLAVVPVCYRVVARSVA